MSALLQQFISEAQDLIEQAGAALLEAEREPNDKEPIDELFRAMHTLKGSSGLLDVPPFTMLVHAGEDLLVSVREGRQQLQASDLDLLLDCCDVLAEWISGLEDDGELPDSAAGVSKEKSSALRARIVDSGAAAPAAAEPAKPAGPGFAVVGAGLSADVIAAARAAAGDAPLVAIRYQPDEQCYFRGEDPVRIWRDTPGLVGWTLAQRDAPSEKAEFDPHLCKLVLSGLSTAGQVELENAFRYVIDDVDFADMPADGAAPAGASDQPPAQPADDTAPAAEGARPQARPTKSLGPNAVPDRTELFLDLLDGQLSVLDACESDDTLTPGRIDSVEQLLLNNAGEGGALAAHAQTIKQAFDSYRSQLELDPLRLAMEKLVQSLRQNGLPGKEAAEIPAAEKKEAKASNGKPAQKSRVLKVDEAKIDVLVNLISEFSVAKNALPFLARRAEEQYGLRELSRELKDQFTVVDRLASEMQSAIMSVRLLPVSTIFERFPRLVRDVSRKLGKSIELKLLREDTEADKSIIEALGDPLIHLVRNSLDHGIEPPDDRVDAGKPETATLTIEAQQESDQLIILVKDDGRGINPEKVKSKAVERGVITAEEAAEMDDQTAVNLVFRAGFSTADQVSDLSGRGVGMDAVRSQIQKAGGSVVLESAVGIGTTVRLSLPLSMAVTRVMTFGVCGALFGVPMEQVLETVRVATEDLVSIKESEAFLLRDQLVPVRRLSRLLDLEEEDGAHDQSLPVLVVRTNNGPVGLVVDSFRERVDTILKPLDGVLSGANIYSGAALMGDGSVLLVLNPRSLI